MTHPTTRDLERCLAKWAGVDIINVGGGVWVYFDGADKKTWHPLTDANQMELIKVGLRKKEIFYSMQYVPMRDKHCYRLISADNMVMTEQEHESELYAFALAVWELDQQQMKGDA